MQTQTIKVGLTINGHEVHVGHKFLENIARNLPDISKNQSIFEQLAYSENPEVRENVARNDSLNKHTVIKLALDHVQDVAKAVLSNRKHAKVIDEEVMNKLMAMGNIELLCEIASSVEDFVLCDICDLVNKLSQHTNARVRYALCNRVFSDVVSVKILQKLVNDEDVDVSEVAREALEGRL